jgi:hypothetical protein
VQSLLASGIPVTVSIGAVGVAENGEGGSIATFSSRGLGFGGIVKPELAAPGVAVPTSEPGRAQDGEVRYGTVSGTSVAAAVAAGAAAVLAQGHPRATATDLAGLLVGSATPLENDSTAAGAGLLDLRGAVQQEIVAEPSAISFGSRRRTAPELERTFVVRNVSARPLSVSIDAKDAPVGVSLTVDPSHLRLPVGASEQIVARAETSALPEDATAAEGTLMLRVGGSTTVRLPWGLAIPSTGVRLISGVTLKTNGGRVSDATPDVLELVAGAVIADPGPQVRPVDLLAVQLWRGKKLLGVLASRRELLPGRYTFGLTGRGPDGARLRRGAYTVRIVVRPGDGTPSQAVTVPYRVR